MRKHLIYGAVMISVMISSCRCYKTDNTKNDPAANQAVTDVLYQNSKDGDDTRARNKRIIGGDDAAMGYTWSRMLRKKIRIFDEGQRVHSVTDSLSSFAGYLVFDSDSSHVEFFYPQIDVVLDRRKRPDGTSVWNVEDDDTYQVEQNRNEWLVSRRGRLLFASSGTADVVKTIYLSDKEEEIKATFFNKAGVVEININGWYQLLRQYTTKSGYGYSNPVLDLRGRNREAVLTTLSDGSKLLLKEK